MIEVLKQMIAALEDCSANKHHSRNSAIQAGFKAITDLEKQNFAAIDWGLVHEKLELVWYRELSADEGLDEIQDLIDTTPQPKQEQSTECVGEPVENRFVRELREYGKTNQGAYLFPSWDIHRALKYLHGYTTPQPVTESHSDIKPLTDEQIDTIANSFSTWMFPVETQRRDCDRAIARAIEAAHGITQEKNT